MSLPSIMRAAVCLHQPLQAPPCRARVSKARQRLQAQAKMHVPRDVFSGNRPPEQRAAELVCLVATAVAVRVVLAQLGGGGEGGDLPPTPDYLVLRGWLEAHPLAGGDGDEWLARLTEQHQMLGIRVMEVRAAYAAEQFDWQQCRQLAEQRIADSNVRLLRRHAAQAFGRAMQAADGGAAQRQEGGGGQGEAEGLG